MFSPPLSVKTDVAPSINCCCRPRNCSSESEIQQMALQFWNGRYGGSNQLFMKNGYDHHEHQDIYTYNLSVPQRFTLDVPNQSRPYPYPSWSDVKKKSLHSTFILPLKRPIAIMPVRSFRGPHIWLTFVFTCSKLDVIPLDLAWLLYHVNDNDQESQIWDAHPESVPDQEDCFSF